MTCVVASAARSSFAGLFEMGPPWDFRVSPVEQDQAASEVGDVGEHGVRLLGGETYVVHAGAEVVFAKDGCAAQPLPGRQQVVVMVDGEQVSQGFVGRR